MMMIKLTLRLPYKSSGWIAPAVALAVFAFLLGCGFGVDAGYRDGQRETTAALRPDIDANAAEIAVLNERLINLRAAMQIETLASFYGESHRGKLTASGVPFDPDEMTAASPWLPLGSKWRVTKMGTNVSIVVTITDRGPTPRLGRGLDLSLAAAKKLGMIRAGVCAVRLSPEI
jgi:rare lipoprotein A